MSYNATKKLILWALITTAEKQVQMCKLIEARTLELIRDGAKRTVILQGDIERFIKQIDSAK